jgi:hypothetical protein
MRCFASMLAALLLTGCASPHHVQVHDATFDATVSAPAFTSKKAKLLFDDGHDNFHRSDGRYKPFVTLMRNDGLTVTSNQAPFTASSLAGHDILVIANASGGTDGAPAFTDAEVEAVTQWVENGGGLLLIADHTPFGLAANALSRRLGVRMLDAHLKDEQHSDPSLPGPYFLLFTRENGLLGTHPILEGRTEAERIYRVVTFGGQALHPEEEVVPLLILSPSAMVVRDPGNPASAEPIPTGALEAAAMIRGKGRVVIIGEAAALTSQVITGDAAKAAGMSELRIGMSRSDLDNKQLALNIVRWLAGRLD